MGKTIKLNLAETAKPVPAEPVIVKESVAPFKEKSPCNFAITSLGDGKIIAVSRAGDSFTGTITEFNKRIRS
jgi:hypothetical protein